MNSTVTKSEITNQYFKIDLFFFSFDNLTDQQMKLTTFDTKGETKMEEDEW